jgi:hypothetical protein
LAGPNDNPILPTGPPGYIGWRNRFLGSLNVFNYGLRTPKWTKLSCVTPSNSTQLRFNGFSCIFEFKNCPTRSRTARLAGGGRGVTPTGWTWRTATWVCTPPPWRTSGRAIENSRLMVEVLLPKLRAELDKLDPTVGKPSTPDSTRVFSYLSSQEVYSQGSTAVARTSTWTSSSNAWPATLGSMGVKSAGRYQSTIANRFIDRWFLSRYPPINN